MEKVPTKFSPIWLLVQGFAQESPWPLPWCCWLWLCLPAHVQAYQVTAQFSHLSATFDPPRNKLYLNRAFKFAEFLFSDTFRSARTPDSPLSLYEGWSGTLLHLYIPGPQEHILTHLPGTVCFLADLLNPDQAAFPFSEVFYWSTSQFLLTQQQSYSNGMILWLVPSSPLGNTYSLVASSPKTLSNLSS